MKAFADFLNLLLFGLWVVAFLFGTVLTCYGFWAMIAHGQWVEFLLWFLVGGPTFYVLTLALAKISTLLDDLY